MLRANQGQSIPPEALKAAQGVVRDIMGPAANLTWTEPIADWLLEHIRIVSSRPVPTRHWQWDITLLTLCMEQAGIVELASADMVAYDHLIHATKLRVCILDQVPFSRWLKGQRGAMPGARFPGMAAQDPGKFGHTSAPLTNSTKAALDHLVAEAAKSAPRGRAVD